MHLQRDLDNLRKSILLLGAKVEENINHAITLQANRDLSITAQMRAAEDEINEMEVTIEEECLKVLALHQPVAVDLRFIIVVLKVNNDLERMGDQAINVLERIEFLAQYPRVEEDLEFEAVLDYRKRNRTDSTVQLVLQPNPSFLKEVTITPPVVKLKYE